MNRKSPQQENVAPATTVSLATAGLRHYGAQGHSSTAIDVSRSAFSHLHARYFTELPFSVEIVKLIAV